MIKVLFMSYSYGNEIRVAPQLL